MRSRLHVVVTLMVGAIGSSCSGSHRVQVPTATTLLAPTTGGPTTSTTSTAALTTAGSQANADSGLLTQTTARPSATDPALLARIKLLWQAMVDGAPPVALPAFFPRSAYLQVKAIRDPSADWQYRLVAAYDRDLLALHHELDGASATFLSIQIPSSAAVWVRPGQEYNKIGYWRVYGSSVRYTIGGQVRSVRIASLISWRGQWYVVHLN